MLNSKRQAKLFALKLHKHGCFSWHEEYLDPVLWTLLSRANIGHSWCSGFHQIQINHPLDPVTILYNELPAIYKPNHTQFDSQSARGVDGIIEGVTSCRETEWYWVALSRNIFLVSALPATISTIQLHFTVSKCTKIKVPPAATWSIFPKPIWLLSNRMHIH